MASHGCAFSFHEICMWGMPVGGGGPGGQKIISTVVTCSGLVVFAQLLICELLPAAAFGLLQIQISLFMNWRKSKNQRFHVLLRPMLRGNCENMFEALTFLMFFTFCCFFSLIVQSSRRRVQVKGNLSGLDTSASAGLSVAGQFSSEWFMEASGNQGNPTDLKNAQALWGVHG